MKATTEKPIEVTNDRDELNALIAEYYTFLENNRMQSELIADLERNLEEVDQEIIIAQAKAEKPVYPKMRSIADIDEFIDNFGAPKKRLELLLEARKQLLTQIAQARNEYNRYVDFASDIKKDTWRKLAKILIKPIHYQVNQAILAVGNSGGDFISFLLSENANNNFGDLGSKLKSDYGMPL